MAIDLARALIRAGDGEVCLIDLYRRPPNAGARLEELQAHGIAAVEFLGLDPARITLRDGIVGAFRLRRILMRRRVTIIETGIPSAGVIAALACGGLKVRIVMGIHAIYGRAQPFLRQPLLSALGLAILRKRAQFYAVSDCAGASWSAFAGVPARKVPRIYNSVRDGFFEPAQDRERTRQALAIPGGASILLFVGRLTSQKGIKTLLAAAAALLERRNAHLVCAGDFPSDTYAREVRDTIARLPCAGRVHLLGYRTDVPQLMRAADLLVLPTRKEGFGLVLAEALASRLPIVASDAEAVPEILAGTQSILVPPDDAAALGLAIETALDRPPAEVARVVALGLARSQTFRNERRTAEMLGLFRRTLNVTASI